MTRRIRLLDLSLFALGAAALLTLARTCVVMAQLGGASLRPSCTLAASTALLVGSIAALRNRTWGLLLVLVATVAFGGAWAFGIGPAWFGAWTGLGALALGLAAPPLARRDPWVFGLAVALCLALGASAAGVAGPGLEAARERLASRQPPKGAALRQPR